METLPTANDVPHMNVSLIDINGEVSTSYIPLALMYLQSAVEADESLRHSVSVTIHAFPNNVTIPQILDVLVAHSPNVVGFSCQGWNFRKALKAAYSLKQILPGAYIVAGGNHVSNRGAELLPAHPQLDLIVNGEGEATFCDLLKSRLDSSLRLEEIPGVSFRSAGEIVTTAARPRAKSLDALASPYAGKPIEFLASHDVALLETNRGCPYHCSFCYWGGAVGSKLSQSETAWVRSQLEAIARARIKSVFLCDANFGILEKDKEIARMLVEVKREYGYPQTFHVNWAKNHAFRIEEIVRILRAGGIHSNVFVALQTLHHDALRIAGRQERGRAEMFELGKRMVEEGQEIGCELIFGLPGERLSDFLENYDRLFLEFPNLLLHPLWILPNTKYHEKRKELGIITIQSEGDTDYEGIFEHATLSRDENRQGLAMLLSEEILIGTGAGKNWARALAHFAGIRPSAILLDLERFLAAKEERLDEELCELYSAIRAACYFDRDLRGRVRMLISRNADASLTMLRRFMASFAIEPGLAEILDWILALDCALLPRADLTTGGFHFTELAFPFDASAFALGVVKSDKIGLERLVASGPTVIRIRHQGGFADHRKEAIDLSGVWNGKIAGVMPAGTSEATVLAGQTGTDLDSRAEVRPQ